MAWRRIARRVLKIAAVALASVVALAAAGAVALLLYARSDGGRERLQRVVVERARAAVPGLAIGRIGGDFVRDVVLEGVTVRDREGRAAIQVARVTARFTLVPLLHRRLFVRELVVERPRVLGRPTEAGTLNLAEIG